MIEPGFFRTEFLDGASLQRVARESDDYAATVGKTREAMIMMNKRQPGDPEKLAQALLLLVAHPHPPVRLALGKDTVARIEAKNAAVAAELAPWRSLAESTDFDD